MQQAQQKKAHTATCPICPHACSLQEGERGICRARAAVGARVLPLPFGAYSAISLDPIEKKPLRRYLPGSRVFSIGFYGCNLRCSFCQNSSISQEMPPADAPTATAAEVVQQAQALCGAGNIGIAYTYSEPGVAFEFVLEIAKLAKEKGLRNILVTNGYMQPGPWEALLEFMHAYNIDLKCFSEQGYRSLGGDLGTVQRNIRLAAAHAHVEISTLVVPGLSDSEEEMREEAGWIASISREIPLHISRYFPRHRARMPQTELPVLRRLEEIARAQLRHVYLGNC